MVSQAQEEERVRLLRQQEALYKTDNQKIIDLLIEIRDLLK